MKTKLYFLVLMLGFFISINGQVPTNGLVGYWPFNGNANDESGNGNHGTVNGATLSVDRYGKSNSAYNFDGIDDYIVAPADSLPIGERTVSLWFYLNSVENAPNPFAYGGGVHGNSWFMCINHTETPNSFHLEAHWNKHELTFFYVDEPINDWYHWVITTSSDGTKMYVNGTLVESNTDYISNTGVIGTSLGIGVCCSSKGVVPYTDANVGYFNGKIDDIRVYNCALNQEEINALFQEAIVGLNSPDNTNTIKVYPNPFSSDITIEFSNPDLSNLKVSVFSISGNKVFELDNITSDKVVFNTDKLSKGIYIIELKGAKFFENRMIVKD